jgi:hypothetical protein
LFKELNRNQLFLLNQSNRKPSFLFNLLNNVAKIVHFSTKTKIFSIQFDVFVSIADALEVFCEIGVGDYHSATAVVGME